MNNFDAIAAWENSAPIDFRDDGYVIDRNVNVDIRIAGHLVGTLQRRILLTVFRQA